MDTETISDAGNAEASVTIVNKSEKKHEVATDISKEQIEMNDKNTNTVSQSSKVDSNGDTIPLDITNNHNDIPNEKDCTEESEDKSKKAFDSENDDDDDDDDGIQVTIGDINNQAFEPQKFKAPYQRQGSQSQIVPNQGGSSTKPNLKGVDLDSVGSINGVPIFDYDLDSIKLEDKPWRKPGADITDYFNYGFTEETWTKYCEKQKRLRLENNCKVGLILGNGDFTADEISKEDADIYLGQPTRRLGGLSTMIHRGGGIKSQGVIDVIGSSSRDSRRPHQMQQRTDFLPDMLVANSVNHLPPILTNHMHIQQSPSHQLPGASQSSTATVLPISINHPPPPLNIPPPDFALPPPTAINHTMAPPPYNIMGNPAMLVAPPNHYGVSMPGQFETLFRPPMMGGVLANPINQQKDRRGMPPTTFRFENPYGAPPPFQPPPGMPPTHWGNVITTAPPQVAIRNASPKKNKNNSDISSSEDDARSKENNERHFSENRHNPSSTHTGGRTSRDRSRLRDYDRGRERIRRDYDSSRSRHYQSTRHYGYRDSSRNHRKRDRSPRDSPYDARHGDKKRRSTSSSDSESDYEESRGKK